MSKRASTWLAWGLFALTVVVTLISAALHVRLWATSNFGVAGLIESMSDMLNSLVIALVGAVVSVRRSRNPIGWLLLSIALSLSLQGLGPVYAIFGAPRNLPGVGIAAVFSQFPVWPLPFMLLVLLYPTGHFLSRRWRWLAIAIIIYMVVVNSLLAVQTPQTVVFGGISIQVLNPIGLYTPAPSNDFDSVLFILLLVAMASSVVSLVIRFRRSQGDERLQIKWFAYAAVMFIFVVVAANTIDTTWSNALISVVALALPVAIGIAILRYRLYDIDIIIRRTLVYGILTALLLFVYFGSVIVLQQLFVNLTGQRRSGVVTIISTLAIAALFFPLRRAVQNAIDRRFYRQKFDAEKAITAFGARIQNEVDVDLLASDLMDVVDQTLQPAHLSLWLKRSIKSSQVAMDDQ